MVTGAVLGMLGHRSGSGAGMRAGAVMGGRGRITLSSINHKRLGEGGSDCIPTQLCILDKQSHCQTRPPLGEEGHKRMEVDTGLESSKHAVSEPLPVPKLLPVPPPPTVPSTINDSQPSEYTRRQGRIPAFQH